MKGLHFVLALAAVFSIVSNADEAPTQMQLKVKPDRCIALRQGQNCFQKLRFSWVTPKPGDYCLYVKSSGDPLACWKDSKLQRFEFQLESPTNKVFFIRDELNKEVLREVTVNVAWVYKNRKKISTGWRLF